MATLLADPAKHTVIYGEDVKLERVVCTTCKFPVGIHAPNATGCCLTQDELSVHREWLLCATISTQGTTAMSCMSCWQPFTTHPGSQVEGQVLQ